MKKLRTGKDADESSLSHTKWNCMYHIVFIKKLYIFLKKNLNNI